MTAWTGSEMLIWGGRSTAGDAGPPPEPVTPDGGAYNPRSKTWRVLPPAPIPPGNRLRFVSAWTGSELLVAGWDSTQAHAAAYSPGSNSWRALAAPPGPSRWFATTAWSGRELFIFSGETVSGEPIAGGVAFDLRANQWRPIPEAPISPRSFAAASWTGKEFVVAAGSTTRSGAENFFNDAAAYDPTRNFWRTLPPLPIPPRREPRSAWNGHEWFVFGGVRDGGAGFQDGAAFDPAKNQWRRIALSPLDPRWNSVTVAAGSVVVELAGRGTPDQADGAAYDPTANSWQRLPFAPLSVRSSPAVVWTGESLIVWGGVARASGYEALGDGAVYTVRP